MWVLPLWMLVSVGVAHPASTPEARFEAWTGAKLVFSRDEAAPEVLYETTPELSAERRRRAAEILLKEAQNYPRGLFGRIGLKSFAVFAGCGDSRGDGYRPWVESLNGYRYFGRWDVVGAIAACYYDDTQLPLTFHHEVFHHLDATRSHKLDYRHFTSDDRRFRQAVAGERPYPALDLTDEERRVLREVAEGEVLEEAVGRYSEKSAGEDQAETARWLQTNLADGLLQAADRPDLAGSQRILHLLGEYRSASPTMTTAWWVGAAVWRGESSRAQKVSERVTSPPVRREPAADNQYLSKVDEAIDDPEVASRIRQVQPATVRLGGGSGVNLVASGLVLTNAHVVDELGRELRVQFPDGRVFDGVTVALSQHFDLALVELSGATNLPIARLASVAPEQGDEVVVIGQPGTRTPGGEPTNYQPWHVSVGTIRGFLPDRLGTQRLGRTKHSAWTYWGHSGSPLFDVNGRIVALHNSWDSKTAMRHAVPWEAIVKFLSAHQDLFTRRAR